MSLENTLTTTSSSFHEEKDYFDIVNFIESTIELQEDNIKAQKDIDQEVNDCQLNSDNYT
jgi:hypothetical protein